MQKEPLAVITAIRIVINVLIQGLLVFGVNITQEAHAYLTGSLFVGIEAVLWLISRNDVWAPAGAPTHPPTEKLWAETVAATKVEAAAALKDQKAEYEALFTSSGHAGADGPVIGRHTATAPAAPLSQESMVALGEMVNPGQET